MLRKKACTLTLSVALSCQLLIAPMAFAGSTEDAVNNIIKDPSYTSVVNQLGVDSSVVEGFVRDVVNKIDKTKINNDSYVKGVVTKELTQNKALLEAVVSLPTEDYTRAKDAVKDLGNALRNEIADSTPPSAGGGGGGAGGGGAISDVETTEPQQEVSEEVKPVEKPIVKKFTDIEGHWAAADIQYMAEKGYVNGVEMDKFQPQALVTRAEFVTMLVNVLGLQGQAEVDFKDVNNGAWYYASVALACEAGLAKGNGQETFAPNAPITRQEMAAMIVNAMKYKGIAVQADQGVLATFVDHSLVADWAKPSAAVAFSAKIIKGKPAQNGLVFGPKDNTTRAEAVVMLKNFIMAN